MAMNIAHVTSSGFSRACAAVIMLQQQQCSIACVVRHQHHDNYSRMDEVKISLTWPCYVLLPSLSEAVSGVISLLCHTKLHMRMRL